MVLKRKAVHLRGNWRVVLAESPAEVPSSQVGGEKE